MDLTPSRGFVADAKLGVALTDPKRIAHAVGMRIEPPRFPWAVLSIVVLFAAASLPLAASPARATTIEALDLDQLVTRSDAVVTAIVTRKDVHYDRRGRIVTDVSFEVVETLKGTPRVGATLVVRCLGGEIGDVGMRVPGEPRFEVGDERLLFLRDRGAYHRAVGMSQGVLPIRRDAQGHRMALPGGDGLHLVRQAGGSLQHASPALSQPVPLHELTARVRQMAGTGTSNATGTDDGNSTSGDATRR